ncbi:hypothetical protein T459_07719 [Capsicum annuum]|uniref:TF-B3 domain-containing protein n=1 Tax=Capsicum annuum TaxID=4072 RepID=A0A2G2ZUG9_CAPAN|nr:hypothetical protein T459_07719 [Capsicum annuum]
MKRDIADFVAKCATCQQVKVEHQRPGGMLQKFGIPLEVETGEYGFGDHFTPLHRQPDSIWVIIDRLTKSTYFLPVYTSYTAENYAKLYIRELVRLYGVPLSIISDKVTKNAAVVNDWINSHRRRLHKLLVGLDIEWLPCFSPEENHPVALLQFCVGRRCLLFQLLHKDAVPRFLVDFLMDPNFKFVGVGVKRDAEKLLRDHKLLVANTVDLNQLALSVYGEEVYGKMGLKRMAKEVLGKVMEKPLNVTLNLRGSPSLQAEVQTKKLDAERMSDKGLRLKTSSTTTPESQLAASTSVDVNSHFISTIKPYTIKNPTLKYLPLDFVKSNGLMDKSEMILVDEKQRSWSMWLRRTGHHFGILRGWTLFKKVNGVQVGGKYSGKDAVVDEREI